MLICTTHFLGKRNGVEFKWRKPSVRHLFSCCQLGISAFVGEISSAITTIIFNMLILEIAGNVGVAAYGVIAIALSCRNPLKTSGIKRRLGLVPLFGSDHIYSNSTACEAGTFFFCKK